MASRQDIEAGKAFVRLFLKNDMSRQLVRALRGAQDRLQNFSRNAMAAGLKMTATGAAIAAPLVLGMREFANFDAKMRDVSTMLDNPGEFMPGFRQGIKDMSVEFGKTKGDLATGLYDILSATVPPELAMRRLAAATKLAAAGNAEVGASVSVLNTLMDTYGDSFKDAGDASDFLFGIVKRGRTNLSDLSDKLGSIIATAKAAGMSVEDMGASVALLTRATGGTDTALTALNAISGTFLKPGIEGAALWKQKFGDAMDASTLKTLGMTGVLERLSKLNPDEVAKIFPNMRAIRGIFPAIAKMDGFSDDLSAMASRAGNVNAAFEKTKGPLFAWNQGLEQGKNIMLEIGRALVSAIEPHVKTFLAIGKAVEVWVKNNKQIVVAVAATAAGLVAAGVALVGLGVAASVAAVAVGGLATVAGGVFAVFRGVGGVLTLPFRLLGSAAQTAAGLAKRAMRTAGAAAAASFRGMKAAATWFAPLVTGAAKAGVLVVSSLQQIGPAGAQVFAAMGHHAQIVFRRIGQYGQAAWPMISGAARAALYRLFPEFDRFAERAQLAWRRIQWATSGTMMHIQGAVGTLRAKWGEASTALAGRWQAAMVRVASAVSPAVAGIAAKWSAMTIKMRATASQATGAIAGAYAKLPAWVRGPLHQIVGMAKLDAIKTASAITGALRRVGPTAARGIVTAMSGAFARIRAMGAVTGKRLGMLLRSPLTMAGGMGRGLGGALGGAAGAAGLLGAMGIGGALAPVLMMAPIAIGLLGSLGTVVAAIAAPVGVLTAAVVGGAVAWAKYSESGKQAWAALKAAVIPIIDTLKASFGGVKDALMAGDWGLAGQIAMAGLKLAVLQGLAAIQEAFPKTFGTILRVVGKIGDGIVMAWGKVTGFLTEQWNGWGKRTLDTVMGVASRIPQIWQQTVEGMANWMLEASAKGGVMGKAMSTVLGVDMAEEQAKSNRLNRELGLGTTDVLADARKAVNQYTEGLIGDAKQMGGEPGTGKVSESLDAFLSKLESGSGIEDASKELAALREEAGKRQKEVSAEPAAGSGALASSALGAGGGAGSAKPAAIPTGVALTATYSAAAASISGYQPGGGPEEQMASGIAGINDNTKQMLANMGQWIQQNETLQNLYERFLAGWKVA